MFGSILTALVAASFLGLGTGAFVAPRALADTYGMPVETSTGIAYVRALGARDAVLGLLVIAALLRRDRRAMTTTVALSALAGATDLAVVASERGTAVPLSLAIHGTGTLGLLGVAALLSAGI